MPAISSGIFAVPLEVCARAYVAGVRRHIEAVPSSIVSQVRLCLRPSPLVDLVRREIAAKP
jgi:O-acetyl-ADP-ribose deacetylase (regulator of RNase III)